MIIENRLVNASEITMKLSAKASHILKNQDGDYDVGRASGIMDAVDLINKSPTDLKRYNIYYRKYNIITNTYIPHVKVVNTSDIYHEIGQMICNAMERIESISYTEPKASQEDCEKLWSEDGYRKLKNNIWICDKVKEA